MHMDVSLHDDINRAYRDQVFEISNKSMFPGLSVSFDTMIIDLFRAFLFCRGSIIFALAWSNVKIRCVAITAEVVAYIFITWTMCLIILNKERTSYPYSKGPCEAKQITTQNSSPYMKKVNTTPID